LKLRLPKTFVVHCSGLGVAAISIVDACFIPPAHGPEFLTRVVLLSCYLGTLLGYPAVVLTVICSGLRRSRTWHQ
jgi:hypothetical protein